jgi:predicted nuclease of predicted toxin-antitoxin system
MIWLDAQLPPSLGNWIEKQFNMPCRPVRMLGLRDATDLEIFKQAKIANVIVMSKDKDFVELLYVQKAPPKIIWLTCGNTSKTALKELLNLHLQNAMQILENGEDLVEIQ